MTQILTQDHTHFAGFQLNMLGDSIIIDNFNCNPIVLKKIGKTSKVKIAIFGPNQHKKGVSMDHAQNKNNVFCRNNKADHNLSKTFYFILAEL